MAAGLPSGATTAGWWVERKGGLANVRVDPDDTFKATLNGQRAGLVHVHVVVGERVATAVVRVTPTVRPSRLRLSPELAKSLLRRPIQIPGPPPVEQRPPGWVTSIR